MRTLIVASLLLAVAWLGGCATLNRPPETGARQETSAAQPLVASTADGADGTAEVSSNPSIAQPLSSPPESDDAKSSDAANAERYLALRDTLTQADAARSAPAFLAGANTGVLELHFIDVGQGDATLIVCPNGSTILVDAGSLGGGDEEAVRDYIWERLNPDSPSLDVLVVTHADTDHYNLIPYVLDGVAVKRVLHVGEPSHYATKDVFGGHDIDDWFRSVASKTKRIGLPTADEIGEPSPHFACGSAKIFILAADVKQSGSWWKNTRSIVLKVSYGLFDAILTGDATTVTEKFILDRHTETFLRAEVLKLGHHGSSTTSTSPAWADAVQPEVSIASAAFKNSHGHPRRDIVNRVAAYTLPWDAHDLVSSTGPRGNYRWHWVEDYDRAVFNTASSGTVVVLGRHNGTYEVTWFDYDR